MTAITPSFLLLAVALALSACSTLPRTSTPPATHADITRGVFKTAAIEKRVLTAPIVTASHLHFLHTGSVNQLASYNTVSTVPLTPAQTALLRRLLANPASYSFHTGSRCGPEYGVVFHFRQAHRASHVAICFHCSIVGVFDGTASVDNGVGFNDLASLETLCKELFPADPEIQRL